MKKKILITGGAGFIGSHLAEYLIDRGDDVVVIDNLSTGVEKNISGLRGNASFKFVKADTSNIPVLEELIVSCDVIYHLAASVGVKLVMSKPVKAIENNINGILNILRLAKKYKRKIFLASSSEVYGKAGNNLLKETQNLSMGPSNIVRWSYGCAKALSEYLALSYYKEYELPVTIGRFFNICGPRQTGAYGMVIPGFVASALRGDPITVFGDGTQTRSFTYVFDAVQAAAKLMDMPDTVGEVYNIGNPVPITILELANMVKKLTKSNSPITYIPYDDAYGSGFEDMHYRTPDISKIKKAIGFEPKVNLSNILESIIDYWKQELITSYRKDNLASEKAA